MGALHEMAVCASLLFLDVKITSMLNSRVWIMAFSIILVGFVCLF